MSLRLILTPSWFLQILDDSLLPHIEKIQSAHHVINLQREEIDKQNTIIQTLQDKLDKVE
jgi:hypothetical protein